MPAGLAPVYLDDTRVSLQGDPRPKVAKILQAGGKPAAAGVQVVRLRGAGNGGGDPLRLDDTIDRTAQGVAPVYLRCVRAPEAQGSRPAGDEAVGGVGGQGRFQTRVPGDILRGTEASAEARSSGEQSARAGRAQGDDAGGAVAFAQSQSFADPAHKGGSPRKADRSVESSPLPPGHEGDLGGIRTQETAREEGGRTRRGDRPVTTTSRASLDQASEEE